MPGQTKNPIFVESGRLGARTRWGPPRTVRLDDLTLEQARLVRALVEAARQSPENKVAAPAMSPGAAEEARRARGDASPKA